MDHLNQEQRESLMVGNEEVIQIMRVVMADLPPAITEDMIREALYLDPHYIKLNYRKS